MTNPLKIIVNPTKGQILNCPKDISDKLFDLCSYQFFNYQYSQAYIDGYWDGYVRKFSKITKSFPAGLLFKILSFLKKEKAEFKVVDSRRELDWEESTVIKNINNFKFTLRPYQIDGVMAGLKFPYMVFWWATSSGKTVLFSALISALKAKTFKKTLILVANKDLASQHREEIGSMLEEKIGVIEEGKFNPRQITVAVINTLWQKAIKKKDKQVLKYLSNVDHLILDECHRIIDSKMFKNTIAQCKNTIARHGFSGSPYSLTSDDIELECLTGPPLSKVTMSQLIREGWTSRPEIFMIKFPCEKKVSGGNHHQVYSSGIVENKIRNEIILSIVLEEYSLGNFILVLVKSIKHGIDLKKMFIKEEIFSEDFAYIHGSTNKDLRSKVREQFKKKNLKIVIASQIWNEGIDIPAIDVLIKADGGGGSEVQEGKGIRSVIQQTGRILRKPILDGSQDVDEKTENVVRVYDFFDDCHKDLARHSFNRLETYNLEKEFTVKLISFKDLFSGAKR